MGTDDGHYACTLDDGTAAARAGQVDRLTARLLGRERAGDRLVLRFEPGDDTVALVEEFVRDESRCCSFFGFDVRRTDAAVVLQLSAPEGAGHLLDAAMESFAPGTDPMAAWREQRSQGTVEPGG